MTHSILTLVQDTSSHEGTLFPCGPYKTTNCTDWQQMHPSEHICFRERCFRGSVVQRSHKRNHME